MGRSDPKRGGGRERALAELKERVVIKRTMGIALSPGINSSLSLGPVLEKETGSEEHSAQERGWIWMCLFGQRRIWFQA